MEFLSDTGVDLRFSYFNEMSVMRYTHVHLQYELYFCPTPVEQVAVINGGEYRYKHAAVILSAPHTVHSMSCVDKEASSYERYVFYFGEKTLSSFDDRLLSSDSFGKNIGLLFKLTDSEARELSEIVGLCHGCRSVTELELVFALFVNRLMKLCPSERISRVGALSSYIQDVRRYIAESLGDRIDISDVAKHFAVSRSKLDRDFKRFTGMTVHSYFDMCRVNKARYLLQKKDMSLGEVSAACGFESESCFYHFFKRVTGKTPSEMRTDK